MADPGGRSVRVGRGLRRGPWQVYDVADGLPSPRLREVAGARDGTLWLGTSAGLTHFDGSRFTTYVLTDLTGRQDLALFYDVRSIHVNDDGSLWVGMAQGVCLFDGGALRRMEFGTALPDARCVLVHDNDLVGVVSDRRLLCREGDSLAPVECAQHPELLVHCACLGADDTLWVGTDAGPAICRDGALHLCEAGAPEPVRALGVDPAGQLWYRTAEHLCRLGGEAIAVPPIPAGDHTLPSPHSMVFLPGGTMWLTLEGGIGRLDADGLTQLTAADGLPDNRVYALWAEQDGHIWVATDGGLVRHDPDFRVYTVGDGLPDNGVMSLCQDSAGVLWVGTWSGACRLAGERFEPVAGTESRNVWDICQAADGAMWFASRSGLLRLDGVSTSCLTCDDGLIHDGIRSVVQDRSGAIWVATQFGISRYAEGRIDSYPPNEGPPQPNTRVLYVDRDGALWLGTGGGVGRYDGETWRSYLVEDGLVQGDVTAICQDSDGHMWLGTSGGVSRHDGRGFVSYKVEDGLAYDIVLDTFQDSHGILWFATYGGGLSRFDGDVFQTIDRRHGLPNNAVQQFLEDRDGRVWIATEDGLVRCRPNRRPPTVAVESISADRHYDPAEELVLPDSVRLITIELAGRSLTTHPHDLAYLCRLEGGSAGGSLHVTREPRVELEGLTQGAYTLHVQVVDLELNRSPPAILRFEVIPDPHLASLNESLAAGGDGFVGEGPALARVQAQLREVAGTEVTVLILGETGTGKGLAARTLHRLSQRPGGPLIQVNCGAIPEGLVESELFGHERGAFTGATHRKLGKVELAQGGTLFLDEIGDLAPEAQAKLLRVLEEGEFERVGGTKTLRADARIVAATNRDLTSMVDEGTFRADLYFRLQVFRIQLPPLRERREDIPLLAQHFMRRMTQHLNKENVRRFSREGMSALQAYRWPGNVRELEHVVQRAVIVCTRDEIRPQDIALGDAEPGETPAATTQTLESVERRHIQQILEQTGWVVKGEQGAAAILGLNASTLRSRMKKLRIERP